uniref:hypothetical protein n=1 Tax=Alistipes communis TaxID=2585118 RepID=UPI003FD896CC
MKFLYYPVIYRHEKYGWTTKLNTIRTTSLIFPRYRIIEKRRSSAVRFSEMRSLFEVMDVICGNYYEDNLRNVKCEAYKEEFPEEDLI